MRIVGGQWLRGSGPRKVGARDWLGPPQLVGHPRRVVGPDGVARRNGGQPRTPPSWRRRSRAGRAMAHGARNRARRRRRTVRPEARRPRRRRRSVDAAHFPPSSLQPVHGDTAPTSPACRKRPGCRRSGRHNDHHRAPTTTTTPAASHPAGIQSQGVIEPPQQRSSAFGFTGTGAMEVSVIVVGCHLPDDGRQLSERRPERRRVFCHGGALPDASGSCLATVSEPSSESAALTYTITIGPAGG